LELAELLRKYELGVRATQRVVEDIAVRAASAPRLIAGGTALAVVLVRLGGEPRRGGRDDLERPHRARILAV